MENYRKTNNDFFIACACIRNSFGISALTLAQVEQGKWLTEAEIEDFTVAYMAGGEL